MSVEVSGVGSIAALMAKNCLGAAKVIVTVSTEKVDKVDKFLGKGVVNHGLSLPRASSIFRH